MRTKTSIPDSSRFMVFALGLGACATIISGCTSPTGGRTFVRSQGTSVVTPASTAISPVDGEWLHSGGLFRATFREGRFESISPQTGDRLAAGSYSAISDNQVSLNFTTSRGTQENAVCQLVAGTRLNCAPTNGTAFQMNRV